MAVLGLSFIFHSAAVLGMTIQDGFATIELDGVPVRVHYLRAPPMDFSHLFTTTIFFHGLPTSNAIWKPVIEHLSRLANVDAYAISFPGFGSSDAPAPERFDYTETGLNRVPFKVADALGIEDFVGVVHDAGGPWFLCPATEPQHLARLRGLVVLNSGISTSNRPGGPLPGMQRFGVLLGDLSVPRFRIKALLKRILEDGTAHDVVVKFPLIVKEIQTTNSENAHRLALSKVIEEAARNPLGFGGICADSVAQLDVLEPFLIWAPEDPVLGGLDKIFLEVWPNAKEVFVSEALHFEMLDQEEAIAAAIATYLSGQFPIAWRIHAEP